MRTNLKMIATGLLGCASLLAGGVAGADDDLDVCRAGYKALLMTPGECRGYLKELRAAQSKADHLAILDLQEWHASLLIERSQACPCWTKPAPMRSMRMTSAGQQQSASSSKY